MQHTNVDKLCDALVLSFELGEPDLSMRQLAILLHVAKKKSAHIKDIAADLSIPKPAVSRALDRLEILRLCRREKTPEDLRQSVAFPRQSAYIMIKKLEERLS